MVGRWAIVGAVGLMSVGCGGGLKLTKVDAAYRKPSNVAVFFAVQNSDDEPVADMVATDFKIYEDGRVVSIDESRQTIVNPEVAAVHQTLLLVDMSASVTESDQVAHDRPGRAGVRGSDRELPEGRGLRVRRLEGDPRDHAVQRLRGARERGPGEARRSSTPRTRRRTCTARSCEGLDKLDEALDKRDRAAALRHAGRVHRRHRPCGARAAARDARRDRRLAERGLRDRRRQRDRRRDARAHRAQRLHPRRRQRKRSRARSRRSATASSATRAATTC